MKIKKIAAVCKARKTAILLDRTDESGELRQWISTGASLYPVECMPYLSQEHLITMLDLTEKQIEKMRIEHEQFPAAVYVGDLADGEVWARAEAVGFGFQGRKIVAYTAKGQTWFVDLELLEPILAEHEDAELYLRRSGSNTFFAVKAGMLCVGAVWPMQNMTTLAETLKNIGEGYAADE